MAENNIVHVAIAPLDVLEANLMAASHNWWKFDLAISYTLLSSKSIPLSN